MLANGRVLRMQLDNRISEVLQLRARTKSAEGAAEVAHTQLASLTAELADLENALGLKTERTRVLQQQVSLAYSANSAVLRVAVKEKAIFSRKTREQTRLAIEAHALNHALRERKLTAQAQKALDTVKHAEKAMALQADAIAFEQRRSAFLQAKVDTLLVKLGRHRVVDPSAAEAAATHAATVSAASASALRPAVATSANAMAAACAVPAACMPRLRPLSATFDAPTEPSAPNLDANIIRAAPLCSAFEQTANELRELDRKSTCLHTKVRSCLASSNTMLLGAAAPSQPAHNRDKSRHHLTATAFLAQAT